MFYRPWRQPKRLLVPLHLALNTYQSSGPFQPANTHAVLYVSGEQLILESCDRLLEGLTLALQTAVVVDFSD
jgi:hypothetical protein